MLHDQAGNAVWLTRDQLQKFLRYGVPAMEKALAAAERQHDAKTMDHAAYREKHGCVAEAPGYKAAKAGK
jgi:hypothetical protein